MEPATEERGPDSPATLAKDQVVPAASTDLRISALVRATPLSAWAVVALFGILGLVWSIAVPLLHGPDEGAHVDRLAAFDLGGQFGVDPRGDLRYSLDLLAAYPEVGIEPIDHRVLPRLPWVPLNTVDLQTTTGRTLDERPPYPDLAPFGLADARFVNAARSHPPGYYAAVDALDAVVTTFGVPDVSQAPWDSTLARWRAWSALLLLPIPWVAFWVAARLAATTGAEPSEVRRAAPSPRAVGLVAAILTLGVPQLSHSAGTVNNDALLFTGTSVCTLAVAWVATGDRSRAALVWAGVGAGIAAFSKVFGIASPAWIVAAVLVGGRALSFPRWQDRAVRVASRLSVAAGATILAGGFWTIATFLQYRTVAPRGFGYPQPADLDVSVATWLREAAERLTSTGFGRLGIEQFGTPGWSVWLATLLLVGLVAAAFLAPTLRGRSVVGATLLLPFATTLLMVAWAAWGGYSRSGIPSGLHGRYLFVGAPSLAALAAVGLHQATAAIGPRGGDVPVEQEARARRRAAAPAALAALSLAAAHQALGLGVALANWWPGGWWDRFRTATLFSGWSDPMLALLALAGTASLAALAVGLRRDVATSARSVGGAPT